MNTDLELPNGVVLVRTTPTFDRDSVPAGLLKAHKVATGVWGRLVVHTGSLVFMFDELPDEARSVGAGEYVVIPPATPHHLDFDGPVTFAVEFYRP